MTNAVLIRLALASERDALEALQRRASLSNPGDREALLAHPDAIELPPEQIADGRVFVAEQNGGRAGFAVVLPRPDGGAELDGLFVDPALWRKGIGRSLIDYCCVFARAEGATALHVVGNSHAAAFYEACGFEAEGTHRTRFGTGLSMRKML